MKNQNASFGIRTGTDGKGNQATKNTKDAAASFVQRIAKS